MSSTVRANDSTWQWKLQDSVKAPVGGEQISLPGYRAENWFPAVVPGTVLTSLVKDGVYPDPMYGENNRSIPETLCRTSYWYRTEFPVPRSMAGRHVWLKFEGICYCAEVWLNGSKVGSIAGAFCRGDFDVTKWVTPGHIAGLAVKILPPPHPGLAHEHTLATGTGRNGGAMGADGPAMLATVGWDWIPAIRDRDMGIWQGVSLESTGSVVLKDPYVSCDLPLPRTDRATIHVRVGVINSTDHVQTGIVKGTIEGTTLGFSVPVTVEPNETKLVPAPDLILKHPKLWWPNGYGDQHLYRMHFQFVASHRIESTVSTSFGVRTIEYFRKGEENMTIIVNGVPVFAKGGNWGMDDAMKRIPFSRLNALMKLHHDANVTMIRNWIGMSTEEDFYDLCDKYGILVWDDFWLANPYDGPDPLNDALFLANAREKIVRFRNHPSICVWCGRNEGFPPPVINEGLASMIKELDGKRFYQPHSAATNGVGGGGPYSYRDPSFYFSKSKDSMHTEIGAPSIPTLESIQGMMPKRDWWPINDDWAEHDFCKGAQQGDRFVKVIGDRFGEVKGLSDFARKGALATYESYRAMFEGREANMWDPASGILLWMSNPAQPSFVWQLYSYDLDQTAAYFGTQRACEPVHIELDPRDGRVLAINNRPSSLEDVTARATIYNLAGQKIHSQIGSLSLPGSAMTPMFVLADFDPKTLCFIELRLTDGLGNELSRNFYWSGADCREMDTMPTVPLDSTVTKLKPDSEESRFRIDLRNPTGNLAIMAHLQMRRPDGSRVLPCSYSDNYISLAPGESRSIVCSVDTADLNGQSPHFSLDGWNVLAGRVAGRGTLKVVTNAIALP
jgi:hypothetical protein